MADKEYFGRFDFRIGGYYFDPPELAECATWEGRGGWGGGEVLLECRYSGRGSVFVLTCWEMGRCTRRPSRYLKTVEI